MSETANVDPPGQQKKTMKHAMVIGVLEHPPAVGSVRAKTERGCIKGVYIDTHIIGQDAQAQKDRQIRANSKPISVRTGGKAMAEYKCNVCGKTFSSEQELQEHAKTCK
jgi:hypothetical protein